MTTWEYRTEMVDVNCMYIYSGGIIEGVDDYGNLLRTPLEWRHINEFGAQGWELVSVGNWSGSEATAFFKRMLPERVEGRKGHNVR